VDDKAHVYSHLLLSPPLSLSFSFSLARWLRDANERWSKDTSPVLARPVTNRSTAPPYSVMPPLRNLRTREKRNRINLESATERLASRVPPASADVDRAVRSSQTQRRAALFTNELKYALRQKSRKTRRARDEGGVSLFHGGFQMPRSWRKTDSTSECAEAPSAEALLRDSTWIQH